VAKDHRIKEDGQLIAYTCKNYRFRTDISKGSAHGGHRVRGSVFEEPLVQNTDGYSLWLEHVTNDSGDAYYWLMWYDPDGVPTIPMSGILDREHIADMSRLLASFIP
jgi:hypothetical protein